MRTYGYLAGAAPLVAAMLVACGSPPAPTPVAATPPPPKPLTDQDRVQRYQECWGYYNDKKFDQLKDCYDPSAAANQIGYGRGEMINGAGAIVATSEQFARFSPDIRSDAQLILVNGNHVASIRVLSGTNSAPMPGPDGKDLPATNRKFGVMFANVVEFAPKALKVVTEIGAMDSTTLVSQLGMTKRKARAVATGSVASPEIVIAKNDDAEKLNLDAESMRVTAWNKHDAMGVQATLAADGVSHDITAAKDTDNKKLGEQLSSGYWKAFPDAKLVPTAVWAAGDYLVLSGHLEGTNDGAMPAIGVPRKTGKKISVTFVQIDKFVNGKSQESWLFLDSGQIGAQLGILNIALGNAKRSGSG